MEIIPGLCHKYKAVVGKNSVFCWSVYLYGATVPRGPKPFPFRVTWTFLLLQMRGACCLETSGTKYPVTQRHIRRADIYFRILFVDIWLESSGGRWFIARPISTQDNTNTKENVGIHSCPDCSSNALSQCFTYGRQCMSETAHQCDRFSNAWTFRNSSTASINHGTALFLCTGCKSSADWCEGHVIERPAIFGHERNLF